MITETVYKQIAARWKGKVYQKWDKIQKRLPIFLAYLDVFRDKRVLEVGSNAGMYAYEVASVAKDYVGIERDNHYYAQSLVTAEYIKGSARFINTSFHGFVKNHQHQYDTLLASFVLHHFRPKELRELKEIVLPKCNTVVVHTRGGDPFKARMWQVGKDPLGEFEGSEFAKWLKELKFEVEFIKQRGANLIVARRPLEMGSDIALGGKLQKVRRRNYKCPNDGIHRKKDSGGIRGFWWASLDGEAVPFGNWAFYKRLDGGTGLKTFYSLRNWKPSETKEAVEKRMEMMNWLSDFCPEVFGVLTVDIGIVYQNKVHRATAYGLKIEHVWYPEEAWRNFAKGHAYDWKASAHPNHSIAGFKEFRKALEHEIKEMEWTWDALSIGNIMWCTKKNAWRLVDIR